MVSPLTKRKWLAVLLSVLCTLSCLVFIWVCVQPAFWIVNAQRTEAAIRDSFKPYPGAKFIFEGKVSDTSQINVHTLFFWSPDSREALAKYYETTFPTFIEADKNDDWIITAYKLDGSTSTVDMTSPSL